MLDTYTQKCNVTFENIHVCLFVYCLDNLIISDDKFNKLDQVIHNQRNEMKDLQLRLKERN